MAVGRLRYIPAQLKSMCITTQALNAHTSCSNCPRSIGIVSSRIIWIVIIIITIMVKPSIILHPHAITHGACAYIM